MHQAVRDAVPISMDQHQGAGADLSFEWTAADGKAKKFGPLPAYFGSSGKRAAIIGGGPAGLAAARELKRYGHDVVIIECEAYLGGQVRIGVPVFRLPREVVEEDIAAIIQSGIEVKLNHAVRGEEILKLPASTMRCCWPRGQTSLGF